MTKRPVIVHFHLFKNAGTSVDTILQKNFPDSWAEVEGPNNKKLDPSGLIDFIRDNDHLNAVSSHTAVVSVPEYEDVEFIPVFFMRHPIDRIRSAYDFERKQDAQTPGAIKAKEGDFKYYFEWRLTSPAPWQIMNFHASRLKDFFTFTPAKQTQLYLERSEAALSALPFVGLVEQFDLSMETFAKHIRKSFPEFETFPTKANTTSDPVLGLQDNLDRFQERIGEDVYDRLCEINDIDFKLYNDIKQRPLFNSVVSTSEAETKDGS